MHIRVVLDNRSALVSRETHAYLATTAIRLEKAGSSNTDHWLRLRTAYELAPSRRYEDQLQVDRFRAWAAL